MGRRGFWRSLAGLGTASIAYAAFSLQAERSAPDFEHVVLPLLRAKCVGCHGPDGAAGGLRLDSAAGLRKGGDSGPVVSPGKGKQSLLVVRLLGQGGKPRMPMGFAPLSAEEIDAVTRWIDAGAKFDALAPKKHWSYVPPRRPMIPKVRKSSWIQNPIDAFVLARLEKEGLAPSPEADKETLARRVSLDLTGLPPTVAELDRFLQDHQPGAFERLVDRLLASPHYGEKMARAWLDLARYADTNGYEKDLPRQMWVWRDWVIDAFNHNMPFDEFTVEQLAGDLLPNPTQDQLIATGFHRNSMLNDEGGIDPEEFRVVAVMDRVDATATTWLGTTMACAQCHDHKYDPISQRDYYRFYAFFNQTADNGRDKDPVLQVPTPEQQVKLQKLDADLAEARQDLIDRTPSALAQFGDWEARYRASWSVLAPAKWESKATLSRLPDDSLLASGDDPVEDLYVVEYPLSAGSIAALKVEAIPDPRLPEGSSGRNFNGNFVLRKIEAKVVRRAEEHPLSFRTAAADFTQGGHDAMTVIQEGDKPGWAIAGFDPKNRVRHTLLLTLEKSFKAQAGDRLVVRYEHQSRHANHNLGRFRLSAGRDLEFAASPPPGGLTADALAKPMVEETAVERQALQDYYLSIAPDLAEVRRRMADLERQIADLKGALPTTLILREAPKPRLNRILKRGDFRTPGDPVYPGVPRMLGGFAPTSNRLGLARWLVDPKNPLTARVQINRLWEQCFGQGLVATPEDFGTQGERPTHPGLLDWLATEFVARKWDIKAMLRLIVTSNTYRQSAKATAPAREHDPNNLLLSRGPRHRVEAEGVRDIALRASGRLTETVGGPSVMPPQPPGVWENSFTFYDTKDRWVDEEGPNRYRRGLYTYWRRTAPYPMALTFDLKTRDVCVTKRSRTNTPLQALNTLNDPTFVECAGALGMEMRSRADRARSRDLAPYGTPSELDRGDDEGLIYGFRACTSRFPTASDLKSLGALLKSARRRYAQNGEDASKLLAMARLSDKAERTTENAAWTVVANAILNLDETMTKG